MKSSLMRETPCLFSHRATLGRGSIKKKRLFIHILWIRGVGLPMWIIFKFYNIIIKSANVDRGGG